MHGQMYADAIVWPILVHLVNTHIVFAYIALSILHYRLTHSQVSDKNYLTIETRTFPLSIDSRFYIRSTMFPIM